MSTNELV